ncbi:MAG: LysM domain-containing protein [Ilumatobacteraceae bacterium]
MRSRVLGATWTAAGLAVLTIAVPACSDEDTPAADATLAPIQTTTTTSTTMPTTTTQPRFYQVQEGDTLTEIAAAYGLPVTAIMEANPTITDPNAIQAGWILALPLAAEIVATSLPGITTTLAPTAVPTASPAVTTVAP